jgi:hypothetical protein
MPAVVHRVVYSPPALSRLPSDLLPLIIGCLAKKRADRPSTGELLARLSGSVAAAAPPVSAVAQWPATGGRYTPTAVNLRVVPTPPAGA